MWHEPRNVIGGYIGLEHPVVGAGISRQVIFPITLEIIFSLYTVNSLNLNLNTRDQAQTSNMRVSTTTTLFTAIIALTAASPLTPRAGGPAIKPIPSTCTITNPNPTGTAFVPALPGGEQPLYSAYYPSFSTNTTLMSEQCLQQCYGYGDSTQCHAAFWAENVEVPEGFRGAGSFLTACVLFSRPLTASDFQTAPAGQAPNAFARDLAC